MKKKSLGLFQRFVALWRPNFIKDVVLKDDDSTNVWKFWFTINSIFALALGTVLSVGFYFAIVEVDNYIQKDLANFEVKIIDGKLSTSFTEPMVFSEESKQVVLLLDTKGNNESQSLFNQHQNGLLVTEKEIVLKEKGKTEKFSFNQLEKDYLINQDVTRQWWEENKVSFTKSAIILILILTWVFICLIRLIIALFWALLAWMVGKFIEIKNFTFEKAYFSTLYLLTTVFMIETLIWGVILIPYSSFIILCIFFGFNFYHLKKN